MPADWLRIPAPIPADSDRRAVCAILAANGLEVRVARIKTTVRGTPRHYVEVRPAPGVTCEPQ